MTFSLAAVDVAAVPARAFEGADLAGLQRGELMALMRLVGEVKGACDRLVANVAGEVARRSGPEDGAGGFARQQGFPSAEQLVASVLGAAPAEGHTLVRAGQALGAQGAIGEGLREGSISVAKADLIARSLAPLDGDTSEIEARLTRAAGRLDYRRLKLACSREVARFDAANKEAVEKRHYEQRSVEVTEDASGKIHVHAELDAVAGAAFRTYMDAQVKASFQNRREPRDEGGAREGGVLDSRTATQVRADALMALIAHGLDCESPASGVKATIIVRIDADQLEREQGVATCDALATPISLTALRQLAMDATVMRMVVNAKSQVLDFGREQRLFTWSQRMALAERDGGCAKCHAPISHCIAHHIRWWKRDAGPTDIANGVLLCVRCHTSIHRDGWGITVDAENRVWFTPPPEIDPERHRILGGLAALATA